jgi:signal transduction histidine kinase
LDSLNISNQVEGRASGYRRKVVFVYLGLRLLFVATSLVALVLLSQGTLRLDGVSSGAIGPLWKPFSIFSGWSLVLIITAWSARRVNYLGLLDKLILLSLIPDGFAIYCSAEVTGASASPLFRSVYFLIAIHSYHLAVPIERDGEKKRSDLRWRYLGFGVAPSVLVAMTIYSRLFGAKLNALQFWIELGLQLVTAMSFAWLGLEDGERSYALAIKEGEIEVNQKELQVNVVRLDETRVKLDQATESLKKEQSDQKRMLQALGRVSNIAEMKDEDSFSSGLRDLAMQIGRTLEAEYCAVGLANDTTVEDIAVWTSFALSERAKDLLEKSRINPIAGSLIGSVLGRRSYLLWNEHDGDPLDPDNPRLVERGLRMNADAASGYREILPDGEARHLLLIPFYSPHEPVRAVGYLHLINHKASGAQVAEECFTQVHAESLEVIAGQLAIAIENFRSHQRELQEREDDTIIARLGDERGSSDSFDEILAFLNEKIDSRVASLWLPIEDGFGPPQEIRKLVLRSVQVSGPELHAGANALLENKLRQDGLQLHSASYIGRYLDDAKLKDNVYYEPELSRHSHCWSDLLKEIGTPRLLLIAIPDPLAPREDAASPADKFLAVLCLRPRSEDFQLTAGVRERLRRFGRQIENLILEKRLKRRFEQIRILQEGLQRLQVEDLREFYSRLVLLVQNVMGAEACSLFLKDRAPTQLMLKASTAKEARTETVLGNLEIVEMHNYIDQPIYSTSDRSLTVETLRQKQPVLVYNTYDHPLASKRFLEVTTTGGHRSFLGAPLISGQGEVLGVLRCINQQEAHRLLPSFLHSERQFFALLAGVITRFIEGAQSGGAKRKFLREMAHEFTTPLLQAQTNTSFIDRYLRGSQKTKDPLEVVANLRDTLSHLQAMMKDIQFQLERSQAEAMSYDLSSMVDLHALVEQIRKPMIPVARQSKAIEIRGKTSGAPMLRIDRARLGQVLYNLAQNAVKYSRYGGRDIYIEYDLYTGRIEGRSEQQWHRIQVSNFGIGVPEGEEELVFREYVRGSNTQFVATGQSGTGLGLSVSRRIVERHGGFLRLQRRDDPTIFAILLPRSLEEEEPES